jgi:hypothetical protein
MVINLNEFSYFGRKLRSGYFDGLMRESYEWEEIWREEYRRCIEGYSIGGLKISGRLYSYVNFGSIELLEGNYKRVGLPKLRDIDLEIDGQIGRAIREGKNLMIIAGRRLGKSYYGTWLNCYYSVFRFSKTMIAAGREDKLLNAAGMAYNHINGLQNTEFFVPILKGTPKSTNDGMYLGYSIKDEQTGKFIDKYTGGVVYLRNFRDDFTIANGLSTKYVFIEEVGMFDNLKKSYNSMKFCWKEGNNSFGFALLMGTGGDMRRGSKDAYDMFLNCDLYDLLVFQDKENENLKISMFIEGYWSFNEYRDKNNYLDVERAYKSELEAREKLRSSNDLESYYQRIQYSPLSWREAFLRSDSGYFDSYLITQQLEYLERDSRAGKDYLIGWLNIGVNGEVVFDVDVEGRYIEADYPFRKDVDYSKCGVVIYELPEKNKEGKIPYGLYIAGLDPYSQDEAPTSSSLGCIYIYKRMYDVVGGEYNKIVAEYVGRPKTFNEFYEISRRLLIYYNAECLYENNVRGFKEYLENKHCLYLLSREPEIIKDIIKDSYVSRQYGIHMTREIKLYMIQLIKDYIIGEYEDKDGNIKLNITKIKSKGLLKELLNFNLEDNFDRFIGFGLCLLKDINMQKVKVKREERSERKLFEEHFKKIGLNKSYNSKHNSDFVLTK